MTAEDYYHKKMKPEIKSFHDEMMEKLNTNEEMKKVYWGWKVWFSQIIDEPEILFIGINPRDEGGELTLDPDGELQYINDENIKWPLNRDTRQVFKEVLEKENLVDLANCIKTNYYYLATESPKDIETIADFLGRKNDKSALGDRFFENSKKWTRQILEIIKPKLIVCEGKSAFDLLIQHPLESKKIIREEDVYYYYNEILKTNILYYKRLKGGGILNKDLLIEKLREVLWVNKIVL
ncbi:MAG: hypothetical protein M3Z26_13050 [Bacteroidota bacterium]|nr:hypothetical protein [Bacteroidota bacterium]